MERLFYGSGLLEGEDLTDDEWVDVEAALTVMCPNQYGHSEDFLNRHGLTRVGGTLFEFPAKKPTPAPESAQAKPATPPKAESLEALTYCPGLLGSASTEDQCLVTASETFGMVDQLDGANSTMR